MKVVNLIVNKNEGATKVTYKVNIDALNKTMKCISMIKEVVTNNGTIKKITYDKQESVVQFETDFNYGICTDKKEVVFNTLITNENRKTITLVKATKSLVKHSEEAKKNFLADINERIELIKNLEIKKDNLILLRNIYSIIANKIEYYSKDIVELCSNKIAQIEELDTTIESRDISINTTVTSTTNNNNSTNVYTTLYNNDKLNISIQGKTESYTNIFNFTYNIATYIEVYKNDSLIYNASNLYIPLDAPKQARQINLYDYADKLAYYIYYNKLDTYNLNKQLDSFFKDKRTLFLDIRYREIKNDLQKQEKEKRQQHEDKTISNLKQQLKGRCNNKNYAFIDTYDNIFILNNTDKRDIRTIQDNSAFIDLFEDLALYNKDKYNISKEIKDRIILDKDFNTNKTILENTLQLYA